MPQRRLQSVQGPARQLMSTLVPVPVPVLAVLVPVLVLAVLVPVPVLVLAVLALELMAATVWSSTLVASCRGRTSQVG